MKPNAAFLFVAPQTNPEQHHSFIETPSIILTTVGVSTYEEAVKKAKELVNEGTIAIELCAGFGVEGAAMVKKAVEGKAVVGVVRFDHHPAFNFKSGDEMFK